MSIGLYGNKLVKIKLCSPWMVECTFNCISVYHCRQNTLVELDAYEILNILLLSQDTP